MPRDIRIVTEADLRGAVTLDLALVDAIERAFVALASGGVVMPPVLSMDLPAVHGEVDVKTAWIPGFAGFAIKVSPGFFDNPRQGIPSLNGLMILFSATTGLVEAVFLDNGYLTDLRTAAAGAVAARHLAPSEVSHCGVIGTGLQARLQVAAAHLVRPFGRVLVLGRDPARAAACAADLEATLGIEAECVTGPETLAARCQLIVTTTPARSPVLTADHVRKRGLHVTAIGADQSGKNEIDPRLLASADIYACDRIGQAERLGELRSALEAGLAVIPAELGDIIAGKTRGRSDDGQFTICDLTGTGAQDTAIASFVLPRLGDAGTIVRA